MSSRRRFPRECAGALQVLAARRAGDEQSYRARWRDQCMRAARTWRREARERAQLDPAYATAALKRARFWVSEARAWSRALWRGRQWPSTEAPA